MSSIFIDSDLLFTFLAINPERKKEYKLQRTMGFKNRIKNLKTIKIKQLS